MGKTNKQTYFSQRVKNRITKDKSNKYKNYLVSNTTQRIKSKLPIRKKKKEEVVLNITNYK